MTINELIERLASMRNHVANHYGISEQEAGAIAIRGAFQPNCALMSDIHTVTTIVDPDGAAQVFVALNEAADYGYGDAWNGGIVDLQEVTK